MTTLCNIWVRGPAPAAQKHPHAHAIPSQEDPFTVGAPVRGPLGQTRGFSPRATARRNIYKPITPSLLMETIRDLFDALLSIGGLATGAVLSLVSAVMLILSDMLSLDHAMLSIAWIMVAFVFAAGFLTARRHIKEYQERIERDVLSG